MKSFIHIIARAGAAALVIALCAGVAAAQPEERGRLRLDNLDRLMSQASETIRIDFDSGLIEIGCGLMSDTDPEERQAKEICKGLRGIYVRGLEFKAAGQYADSDVAALRAQLSGPGWTRVMDFSTQDEGLQRAEVYAASEGGRIHGLALLFVDPKELTVVNVVGAIDLDKLRRLGDALNIPKIRIERKRSKVVRAKP
jgi:hypothetical protein